MSIKYWLVKSEPEDYSIEDLEKDGRAGWSGVRNYQARNYMRDEMKLGDGVLFYHSNAEPPAIVGVAEVSRESHADPAQFDSKSDYFDPKHSSSHPRWFSVRIQFVSELKTPITLQYLKEHPAFAPKALIARSRLSVMPVTSEQWGKNIL